MFYFDLLKYLLKLTNKSLNMSKNITLKGMHIIGYSVLNTSNEKCVCKRNLMGPSVRDIEVCSVSGCISVGECTHGFHAQCINTYVKDNGPICPICHTPWKHATTIDSSVKVFLHKKDN